MSYADKRESHQQTAEKFEQQLQELVATAQEDGEDVPGAYVAQLDEQTDIEIICTEVER